MIEISQHKKMFIRALKEIHGLEIDEAVKKTIDEYKELIIDTKMMATDPGIATGNTLEDWERNLGLTNTCVSGKTVEERQNI